MNREQLQNQLEADLIDLPKHLENYKEINKIIVIFSDNFGYCEWLVDYVNRYTNLWVGLRNERHRIEKCLRKNNFIQ